MIITREKAQELIDSGAATVVGITRTRVDLEPDYLILTNHESHRTDHAIATDDDYSRYAS